MDEPRQGRPPTRGRNARLLLLAGASALLQGCVQGAAAAGSQDPRFDGGRAWGLLERIVAIGERPSGSASIERLRVLLEGELRALGLEPVREAFRASTPRGEVDFANVYVEIGPPDSGRDAPILVLATHIDTKGGLPFEFVGANDGGSGTAVLLELARCMARRTPAAAVVWRLVFLDGEEAVRPAWGGEDNCYGSRHHVAELRRAGELGRVAACIVLDMVGDRDLRLTRELFSDQELTALFWEAARAQGLAAHVGGGAREIRDDHLSFQAAGIPSVDLIDFEYGPENAWWHSAEDRLDRCSAESLEAIGRIVLAALPELERRAAPAEPDVERR